jgi:hypothetical protein
MFIYLGLAALYTCLSESSALNCYISLLNPGVIHAETNIITAAPGM